jgi:beta-hydroxylase
VPEEKLGFINQLFTHIYKIRIFGMWLKEKNRKLYYVAKWVLFGSLLYWILS